MPADVGWAKTPNVALEKVDALRRKRVLLPSARAAVRILVSPSVAVRLARSTSDRRSSLAAAPAGRGKNLAGCANSPTLSNSHSSMAGAQAGCRRAARRGVSRPEHGCAFLKTR